MARSRRTFGLFAALVVASWLALTLVTLVQFHAGGAVPGDGRGEKLELRKPQ